MENEYCTCLMEPSIYTENDDWGFWDVCSHCNKPKEGTYTYFNHYDGEDHWED